MISIGIFSILSLVSHLTRITCFPQGAPSDACYNILPRHFGTKPRLDDSPYIFKASSSSFGETNYYEQRNEDEEINVFIGGAPFKGFFITAIDSKTGNRIGKWTQVKGTNTIDACSAITHSNPRNKKTASLIWQPPKNEKGSVTFVATILHSYTKYYTPLIANENENSVYR